MIDHETSAGEYVAAQDDGRLVGFKTNHLEDGQVGDPQLGRGDHGLQ